MKWDGRWENSPRTHIWASIRISCVSELPLFQLHLDFYISEMKNHPRCPELIYTGTCILCSVDSASVHLPILELLFFVMWLSSWNWKPFCFAQYWLFLHILQIKNSVRKTLVGCRPCALWTQKVLLSYAEAHESGFGLPIWLGGGFFSLASPLMCCFSGAASQAWFALIWKLKPGCSKSRCKRTKN